MRIALWVTLLIYTPLFLSSCLRANFIEGTHIDTKEVQLIRPGVTTREEILRWFGPPTEFANPSTLKVILNQFDLSTDAVLNHPFEDAFTYEFIQGKSRILFLLLFNKVDIDIKSDVLIVFFDEEGVVKYYAYRKGTEAFFND
jgi:hypothetical protein